MHHECVGDTLWARGTIHMRHIIRLECVDDTLWSRGKVHMRKDIHGTSVFETDGRNKESYI
jgi:hypothetical protein